MCEECRPDAIERSLEDPRVEPPDATLDADGYLQLFLEELLRPDAPWRLDHLDMAPILRRFEAGRDHYLREVGLARRRSSDR